MDCEFDAPKFYDFLRKEQNDVDDRWFDERSGDEGGIDMDLVPCYEEQLNSNTGGFQQATNAITAALKGELPGTSVSPRKEDENMCSVTNDNDEVSEKEMNKSIQKRLEEYDDEGSKNHVDEESDCKKIDATTKIKQETNTTMYSQNDQHKEGSTNNIKSDHKSTTNGMVEKNINKKYNTRRSCNTPETNLNKKDKTNSLPKRNQPSRETKSRSIDYSDTRKRKSLRSPSPATNNVSSKKAKIHTHSLLESPSYVGYVGKEKLKGSKKSQSTEELELNKIKELQKKTHKSLKRNDKSLKIAIKQSIMPNRIVSELEVTKPKEFNFATDKRIKDKDNAMQTKSVSCKPFENQLRHHPQSPNFKNCPTKPKPFDFTIAGKTTVAAAQSKKWESIAQSTLTFQTKTPDRFRARPKKEDHTGSFNHDKKLKKHPIITNPKTPQLMTKGRSRPVSAVSSNDIEDKEVEEMKNYKFKATIFDPKIIEKGGMYGVKQIPAAEATSAKPFHFGTDDRLLMRKQKQGVICEVDEKTKCGNNDKSHIEGKSKRKEQEEPFRPKKTKVEPFSFEKSDKERYNKKEEKIKEIFREEQKLREFHAQPLPLFSPEDLPVVESKQPTFPEPFDISTGSVTYQQKLKQKLEQENQELKTKRKFKAQPNIVAKKEPFKPITGNVQPTQPKNVPLNSELRAMERAKFEKLKREQEIIEEEAKLMVSLEKQKEEERLIKQLRKEAVPKAQGIHHYKGVEIKKGLIPITEPQTPNFETKKRALKKFV